MAFPHSVSAIFQSTSEADMIGVGGVGGFANVDLSAWMGLSGIGGPSMNSATAAVSSPTAAAISLPGMSINLPLLVQMLQQFSLAEILLALLLATNERRCERSRDHHVGTDGLVAFALASALIQQGSFNGSLNQASLVSAVAVPTGMTLNVAG